MIGHQQGDVCAACWVSGEVSKLKGHHHARVRDKDQDQEVPVEPALKRGAVGLLVSFGRGSGHAELWWAMCGSVLPELGEGMKNPSGLRLYFKVKVEVQPGHHGSSISG